MNKDYLDQLNMTVGSEKILRNESMKNHTSFKTGGNCDLMVLAANEEDVKTVLRLSRQFNEPLYVFGNCSNLIVRDKGIRGTVLKIAKGFDEVTVSDNLITAQSGALLSKVAKVAQQFGLTGLEFASGIPGTVGGGVSMNAGAYGGEIKDSLIYSKYIDQDGMVHELDNQGHQFSYRRSFFSDKKDIILSSCFLLQKGDRDEIQMKMNDFNNQRKMKQPLGFPSAGSVFKRPLGYYTGQLIEQSNLKGFNINGAVISSLHAGFIINEKDASSQDIIDLIAHIQETVYNKYKVTLETEVKIVGEE
ncbi:MAG: UDP-N-acetylmuramate dehydrogenase [Clostridia bacterium]|nr:UDP-N-acetylmuramate dehydrogenase [Clostridia bacterium]